MIAPPAPVLLIAGTHGREQTWWRAESPFARELMRQGVILLDPADPFTWTTELDGIVGENKVWKDAGDKLRLYAQAKGQARVSVVAHSHGGNVVAYAAAAGLVIDRLITVATPVRGDLAAEYGELRQAVQTVWIHLYSDASDWIQWLGSWFDGSWRFRRRMKGADLNFKTPAVGHSGLLDPELWRSRGYGFWLAGSPHAVLAKVELIRRGR